MSTSLTLVMALRQTQQLYHSCDDVAKRLSGQIGVLGRLGGTGRDMEVIVKQPLGCRHLYVTSTH